MSTRIRPGIYTHYALGVEPHSIEVSPSTIPVKMEPGFTFAMSEELKKMLSSAFRRTCNLPTSDDDAEGGMSA